MSDGQFRYENELKEKVLPDGRTVFASVRPKVLEAQLEDVTIIADEGDRADIIANNVYGSAKDWWKIVAATKKNDGSLFFQPGQKIVIPQTDD